MNIDQEVAGILLSIGAVKVRMNPPFTWVSGIKSPVYCDNRMLISHVEERQKIIDGFKQIIEEKKLEFDVVGGTATAAIAWAAFLAYSLKKPMIYIRPEPKAHGAGKQIEGDLKAGSKVLIVEDLISTGGSSIKAAEVVRNEGKCLVSDVLAIVSWELAESSKQFAEAHLNLMTLTNFTNIIGLAKEKGTITAEEYGKIMEFKKDPKKWGESL